MMPVLYTAIILHTYMNAELFREKTWAFIFINKEPCHVIYLLESKTYHHKIFTPPLLIFSNIYENIYRYISSSLHTHFLFFIYLFSIYIIIIIYCIIYLMRKKRWKHAAWHTSIQIPKIRLIYMFSFMSYLYIYCMGFIDTMKRAKMTFSRRHTSHVRETAFYAASHTLFIMRCCHTTYPPCW